MTTRALIIVLTALSSLLAQDRPNAALSFEVASIKPSGPDSSGKTIHIEGRTFVAARTTASDLIAYAYHLHPRQIAGAPAWLDTEPYDIVAKPNVQTGPTSAPTSMPNKEEWPLMVQQLLAERFQLAFHREERELHVYVMRVASRGPKLTPSQADPQRLPKIVFPSPGVLNATNAAMSDFAGLMQYAVLDLPVVDRTGLDGRYDFILAWAPDETQFNGLFRHLPDAVAARPDLFIAAREQLGLTFGATRAKIDVLAIDRVERPSAN